MCPFIVSFDLLIIYMYNLTIEQSYDAYMCNMFLFWFFVSYNKL